LNGIFVPANFAGFASETAQNQRSNSRGPEEIRTDSLRYCAVILTNQQAQPDTMAGR